MATTGCTSPKAANYNPAATQDDGSCIFLEKIGGVCYAFQDVDQSQVVDESYTLSYSLLGKDWVFFHDFIPDFYFSTKTQLYNLKGSQIYQHHAGNPGIYHDANPRSFFVDVIFNAETEMILNSVSWLTEVLNQNGEAEFSTLTHITIWNNQQCTGRIAIADIWDQLQYQVRKTQGLWNFDSFRDMLVSYGTKFLLDIFHNFAVAPNVINANKPWFDQDLLHDNYFVIRLEFDNTSGNQLILHGADIDASKSPR
ncbi:MAG: hypothetical protein EO766_13385 [Hydrotalea sp. AMD]|uniref:hypothetical protein n=1 Tax=Hydrotalea sp. AMD TaxID=2501297 RepID=UPI0010286688|nr:hypothetical protein [Hydrotalea sp. AMD]RWZ86793.1 MAG: hypothetical protein EO766_13385 [Hydrotalea sp. AMD]